MQDGSVFIVTVLRGVGNEVAVGMRVLVRGDIEGDGSEGSDPKGVKVRNGEAEWVHW